MLVRLSASAGIQRKRDDPVEFAYWVLQSIGKGSTHESPFLHTTRDLEVAVRWQQLGQHVRRDKENYLVRINRLMIDAKDQVDMLTRAFQDLVRLSASTSQC